MKEITPKEKALELLGGYCDLLGYCSLITPIQCAIIAVDELIQSFTNTCCESYNSIYWQEVKQELEKML